MSAYLKPIQWNLDQAINVVLFAGLGGACAGLEDAGLPVHVANNHDPVALAAHAALFPHTRHVKGDIFDVDPIEATGGRAVNVLWASPDCRDHSIAKGGAPRSARVRSLPWQVCRWAGKTRPTIIMMENVKEIRGWGPLCAKRDPKSGRVLKLDGTVAAKGERVPREQQQLVRDKTRLGRSYRAFILHLERLGYVVEAQDLCCADYGIPTIRKRWFAVARRDGLPIKWMARTHAPAKKARSLRLKPWVAAHTIIDWSLPMASIFGRKRPLAENTLRRIGVGLRKFVIENPRPFIVPVCHSRNTTSAQDGLEPLRTLTTEKGGGFAVVRPDFTSGTRRETFVTSSWLSQRNFTVERGVIGTDLHAPLPTLVTRGTQQAVAAGYLTELRGTGTARNAADPVPTITAGGNHEGIAAAFLSPQRGNSNATDAGAPVSALTCGSHEAVISAFMVKYYGSAESGQPVSDPVHAITTKDRHGVVTVQFRGQRHTLSDIRMRMLHPSEAARAHELTLPPLIVIDGKRRPLTTTESMRLIGNSVPKRMAELLAEANGITALVARQGAA